MNSAFKKKTFKEIGHKYYFNISGQKVDERDKSLPNIRFPNIKSAIQSFHTSSLSLIN